MPDTTFAAPSLSCQIPDINSFYEKYFPGKKNGIFVEVGAYDGYEWSNVWHLACSGWSGLCFEPVPELAARCRKTYADLPVITIQSAVGKKNGTTPLFNSTNATINTEVVYKSSWGVKYDTNQYLMVPVCTLNDTLPKYIADHAFDILSIDVEGAELEVLAGLDLTLWRPKMAILETHKNHPTESFRIHAKAIENWMLDKGFTEIYFDHINSIYVR